MCERFKVDGFEIAAATATLEPLLLGVATKSRVAVEAALESFAAGGRLGFTPMATTGGAPTQDHREKRSAAAQGRARMTGRIARLDEEILKRLSHEIFRDLGLKDVAIAAYFARYDKRSPHSAKTA